VDERHHVLQLIAETEGPTGLVGPAPRPKTARQSLIQEPPVGEHIEDGPVFPPACAESVLPILPDRFEARPAPQRIPGSDTPGCGVLGVSPCAQREDELTLLPSAISKGTWIAAQGSKPAPTLPESCVRVMAAGLRSAPLRPINSVRSRSRSGPHRPR